MAARAVPFVIHNHTFWIVNRNENSYCVARTTCEEKDFSAAQKESKDNPILEL